MIANKMYTHRAIEACAMVVVRQSFYPAIACFDWKSACEALGCEQLIPIRLTVGLCILQKEWTVAEQFAAICAGEAFWVIVLANCIQTVSLFSGIEEDVISLLLWLTQKKTNQRIRLP